MATGGVLELNDHGVNQYFPFWWFACSLTQELPGPFGQLAREEVIERILD